MQDRAAFAKVTVDVYYQDETQGGLVGVDKVARKSRCFSFAPFGMYSTQFVLCSRGRGHCPPQRCPLDRRWETERAAGQACSADWRVLPPAGQAVRVAPERLGVYQLDQRVRNLARHPRLRSVVPPSPLLYRPWTCGFLSYGYRRYLRPA